MKIPNPHVDIIAIVKVSTENKFLHFPIINVSNILIISGM